MKLLLNGLVLMLILSCQSEKKELNNHLNLRVEVQVQGMDPIDANELYRSIEVAKTFEGLLEFDYKKRPYSLIPNLAQAMPEVSNDGLTYTFTLLPNIKFHPDKCFQNENERLLTSEDVIHSFKRLADPKLKAKGWWMIDGRIKGLNEWREQGADYSQEIEGLKAQGDKVIFTLSKPFPQFLYAFAMPITFIVSKKISQCYGEDLLNHPIGTGPFLVSEYNPTHKISYKKYSEYTNRHGRSEIQVESITSHVIVEDQPAWLKFKKGELDYLQLKNTHYQAATNEQGELKDDFKKEKITLWPSQGIDITYVGMNTQDSVLKSVHLRRALSLLYDRERMNKLFYKGKGVKAETVIPPQIAGGSSSYKSPYATYNLEMAKEELKKAGYTDVDQIPELTFEILSDTQSRQRGEFLQKLLSEAGVKLKLSTNTWPELVRKTSTKSAQLFDMSWYADYPDAENFLQLFYGPNASPGPNNSNYNNPEFNDLFEKARLMQDSPERTKLYARLAQIISEDCPWIIGFHRTDFYLTHPWVKNFMPSNFPFGYEKYLGLGSK